MKCEHYNFYLGLQEAIVLDELINGNVSNVAEQGVLIRPDVYSRYYELHGRLQRFIKNGGVQNGKDEAFPG